jgi:hypothetical protein
MSWTSNLRKPGCPKILPRATYAQAIHEIIPTSSPIKGAASKWTAKATDKTTWRNLIKKLVGRKLNNLKKSTNNGNDG